MRRGWYATSSASADVVTATRVGGRLTCLAALRHHGAWTLERWDIHVRVADGIAVARVAGVHLHWVPDRVGPGVDSVDEALRTLLLCADVRTIVVAVDSLANRRILSPSHLHAILESSARGRQALRLHDSAAESGIETLLRLALRRHRVRARSQVVIVGVGRVDFLIGDRLVIEVDGYDWHSDPVQFERDRARDRELVRLGFVVIRASYRQVTTDLDAVILAILAVVRRREHHWRAVHRTQLSESGYLIDLSSM